MVIKKDGSRQPFNIEKIKVGLIKACEKRPVSIAQIDKIAEDIVGVGFKTVDEIAKNSGLEMNSPERIGAGIQYCLKLAMEEGHTYLPRKLLIEKACEVLEIDEELK